MSYTTPMIFEVKNLLIKEFFDSFKLPSLFEVKCVFKIGENKYTQVSYYPSLSSMFIEYSKESIVKSYSNKIENRTDNSNNAVERIGQYSFILKSISVTCDIKLNTFIINKRKPIFNY